MPWTLPIHHGHFRTATDVGYQCDNVKDGKYSKVRHVRGTLSGVFAGQHLTLHIGIGGRRFPKANGTLELVNSGLAAITAGIAVY
jgi:hypothetical protein